MFTWICPQCGREVPPAYDECPDCSGKGAGQAPPQQPGQGVPMGAPPPPASYPPPQQYAQPPQAQYAPPRQFAPTAQYSPPPQYAPPQQYAPAPGQVPAPGFMQQPPGRGISLPPWLMSIGFAVLFLAVGAALFFGIKHFSGSSDASASTPAARESSPTPVAANAPAASKQNSTLQKYVEVAGVRLTEDPAKKPQVHFLVVNHSGAEIADLAANVNLWARTAKSDEEAVGTFSFKLASLGAYESKDMTALLNTKLRVYELPDWQNLTAEVQITSPQ